MNKEKKIFGFLEDSILNNLKNVIYYYYEKLKSFLSSQSQSMGGTSRVLTNTGTTVPKPSVQDNPDELYNTFFEFNLNEFSFNNSGFSTIIVIASLIILIALVIFVTLYILKNMNINLR